MNPISSKLLETKGNAGVNPEWLKKWISYGQNPEIYYKNIEFVNFCFSSSLINQIKISRKPLEAVDGEIVLKVTENPGVEPGRMIPISQICKLFKIATGYRSFEKVIVDGKGHHYTYLEHSGLTRFDGRKPERKIPIAKLSDEEFSNTHLLALNFNRKHKPAENLTHVLQVVTHANHCPGYFKGLRDLFLNRQHAFIRVINPDGEVHEVGYTRRKATSWWIPLDRPEFRSPDFWEYKRVDERVVTNIPISKQEYDRFFDCLDRRNLKEEVFVQTCKNCATFARDLIKEMTNESIPVELSLKTIAKKILPVRIRKIRAISACIDFLSRSVLQFHLPGVLQEWQRALPSTKIFKNQISLSIS